MRKGTGETFRHFSFSCATAFPLFRLQEQQPSAVVLAGSRAASGSDHFIMLSRNFNRGNDVKSSFGSFAGA